MQRCTSVLLSSVLLTTFFVIHSAHVYAQTVLDRGVSASGSNQNYFQLAGLEGPSLRPLQRSNGECQSGCMIQVSDSSTPGEHALSQSIHMGSRVTPVAGVGEKPRVPCTP